VGFNQFHDVVARLHHRPLRLRLRSDQQGDTADGVHPTPAGATKMATTAFDAIVASGYF